MYQINAQLHVMTPVVNKTASSTTSGDRHHLLNILKLTKF